MLALCPCLDNSSITPLERYACAWLAGWRGTRNHWHGNSDQHQRLLESGSRGVLAFCPCLDLSTSAPLERYACAWLAGWRGTRYQGHGNADRHQRVRESGCWGVLAFLIILELPSNAPMELDLALAARRGVASLSQVSEEWLTFKAAMSMTTPLLRCA